jgi:hypothetical protein
MNNIVLVHGAFVDGSGWEGVYKILRLVSVAKCVDLPDDGSVMPMNWA